MPIASAHAMTITASQMIVSILKRGVVAAMWVPFDSLAAFSRPQCAA